MATQERKEKCQLGCHTRHSLRKLCHTGNWEVCQLWSCSFRATAAFHRARWRNWMCVLRRNSAQKDMWIWLCLKWVKTHTALYSVLPQRSRSIWRRQGRQHEWLLNGHFWLIQNMRLSCGGNSHDFAIAIKATNHINGQGNPLINGFLPASSWPPYDVLHVRIAKVQLFWTCIRKLRVLTHSTIQSLIPPDT